MNRIRNSMTYLGFSS